MSSIALLNFIKLKKIRFIHVGDSPPDDNGYLWIDTTSSKFRYYHNGSWKDVGVDTETLDPTDLSVIIAVNPPSDITKLWFDTTSHKLKYYDTVWKTIDAETILGITIDNNTTSGSLWTSDKISSELNKKANINHIHNVSDINGLQNELDNKSNIGHIHNISDINDLQSILDTKADNIHIHTVNDITDYKPSVIKSDVAPNDTDVLWFDITTKQLKYYDQIWKSVDTETIKGITIDDTQNINSLWTSGKITNELNTKAPLIHNHDMDNINGLINVLNNKTDIGHEHSISEITNLQLELNNKANTNHNHTTNDITDYSPPIIHSDTPPTDTNSLWFDNQHHELKYYNSNEWVRINEVFSFFIGLI